MNPRIVLLLCVALLALVPCVAVAQTGFTGPAETVDCPGGECDLTRAPAVGGGGEFVFQSESPEGLRRMSRKERRAAGITFRNIRRKTTELYKAGAIDSTTDKGVASALVFEAIAADNPKAFSDPSFDFDAILQFIEAILPLILKLIALF